MATIEGLTASPKMWIARIESAKARTRKALGTEFAMSALMGPL